MNSTRKPVAVVVGATSKWQADGRNTKLAHGKAVDDSDLLGVREQRRQQRFVAAPVQRVQRTVRLRNTQRFGLRSAYVASYFAAPLMVRAQRGLIAFTSSFGASCYMHGPAYGAQKVGVDKFAADMAVELAPHGKTAMSPELAARQLASGAWGMRYPGLTMQTTGRNTVKEFTGMWPLKPDADLEAQHVTERIDDAALGLRREIFRHLQRMHIGFYDRNPVGRLVTRVTTDVDALNDLFAAGVVTMINDIATMISFLSQVTTFYPGDLLTTGNPDAPEFQEKLKPGDVLKAEIEGIGAMSLGVAKEK